MSERRSYSVQEVNALRDCLTQKYLFGRCGHTVGGGSSRSYKEEEMVKCVEEMVRTHMMAGHTASDLIASETKL